MHTVCVSIRQERPRVIYPKVGSLGQGIVLMLLARADSEVIDNDPKVGKNVRMRLTLARGWVLRSLPEIWLIV